MPQASYQQRLIEFLDGMLILALPKTGGFQSIGNYARVRALFNQCQADIYHSQALNVYTYFAKRARPQCKHILTFQDPLMRELDEIIKIWSVIDPARKERYIRLKNNFNLKHHIERYYIAKGVPLLDATYCQAKYIAPIAQRIYHLTKPPEFLPNPVPISQSSQPKADDPTVCTLSRLDPVKNHELLFQVAQHFPHVKFIVMGKAHNPTRDRFLRERYGKIPNVQLTGFVTETQKAEILSKSWILANTSIHEGLPVAFLEGAAHKCAILSYENPDNFAQDFGYHVKDYTLTNFQKGLQDLLTQERWRTQGKKGYAYVQKHHEINHAINQHIEVYQQILDS
jgi:glycosyltransferase involved in cell wall biosynthesis